MTLAIRPVTRETAAQYRRRPLVVTILPRHLEIREKGRRDTLQIDYATLYEWLGKRRYLREQEERRRAKKAKKG